MASADTITAIATAAGRGGIGVVRVSGPTVPSMIGALVGRALKPREVCLVHFRERNGELIDVGLALYFAAPHSYTGEDVLELHGHGGPAVLSCLLRRSIEEGARVAAPGEFSKRAYLNGKIDLLQAEAVADLIAASSDRAVRSAARSMTGEFSRRLGAVQAELTAVRVVLEGALDFPEEGIDFLNDENIPARLRQLQGTLDDILRLAHVGRRLQEGLRLAIIGPPNAGKSSLLNALARDDVAIVMSTPGTTRDVVRQTIVLGGIAVHVMDTAGVRPTDDAVEQAGIERSWRAAAEADLVLVVDDQAESSFEFPTGTPRVEIVRVHNKIDLLDVPPDSKEIGGETHVWLSAKTHVGLELLERSIVRVAGAAEEGEGEFIARQRHVEALQLARAAVLRSIDNEAHAELAAEDLTAAQSHLSQVTGAMTSDDLLGEIFSRFCIGK